MLQPGLRKLARAFRQLPAETMLLVVFGAVFASISLVNHYLFRTSHYDYGLYLQRMYFYREWLGGADVGSEIAAALSDHTQFLLALYAPFSYLFGHWTPLLFELAALIGGAWGMRQFIYALTGDRWRGLVALLFWGFFYGVYSTLGFNYYDNVVATSLTPWFLLAMYREQFLRAGAWLFLILIARETMGFNMFFIGLALAWTWRRNPARRNASLIAAAVSLAWLAILLGVIIPACTPGGELRQLRFSALGDSASDILAALATRPVYALELLFTDHMPSPGNGDIKQEFWLMFMASGGVLLLFRPALLWMALPALGLKMYHDSYMVWGINNHYSIEFLPILAWAVAGFRAPRLLRERWRTRVAAAIVGVFIMLTAIGTFVTLEHRVSLWYIKKNHVFYAAAHYTREFDVSTLASELKRIPDDAPVSAITWLGPRLALRDTLLEFPNTEGARYVALVAGEPNPYPLGPAAYAAAIAQLDEDPAWRRIATRPPLLLWKRANP